MRIFIACVFFGIAKLTQAQITNQKFSQKTNLENVLAYKNKNEIFYCVPGKEVSEKYLESANVTMAMVSPSPGCVTEIICYKCCVGEKSEQINKEKCEKSGNKWNQGRNCGCN